MFPFYNILRRWVYGWNSNTIIPVFDVKSLQEFFLVFTNFIMSNAAFYNNSSCIGFTSKCIVWYNIQLRNTALTSEICFRHNTMSMFWLKIKVFSQMFNQSLGIPSCYFKWIDHYVVWWQALLRCLTLRQFFSSHFFQLII